MSHLKRKNMPRNPEHPAPAACLMEAGGFQLGQNRPRVTIGVATYNRPELLKECVQSILHQTFPYFEVVIANDYVPVPVTFESLGIPEDPRIKIVNHSQNIGAWANHNFLLRNARGEWFTWLADDDLIHQGFFEFFRAIHEEHEIDAVFCNYESASSPSSSFSSPISTPIFSVEDPIHFLKKLANRSINTIGLYGIMRREMLVSMGGYLRVGQKVNFGERLFPFYFALNGNIVYVNERLHFFRAHSGSPSATQEDMSGFFSSTSEFLVYVEDNFRESIPPTSYSQIKLDTMKWMLRDCVHVVGRSQSVGIVRKIFFSFKGSMVLCKRHLSDKSSFLIMPFVVAIVFSEAYNWLKSDVKSMLILSREMLLKALRNMHF